ncbi:hypothetical protein FHW69_003280 [Luteibacter sp. Sphag1AF]|uniref:L,D-transpeptidase n=1 Tax=Luteibacter sp. Sphag1AF TaxID=2587031 RepID=UPI0016081505|nr:L,D-transpeptidase [Luteibacter sp. Sphag1AF]MBB3228638.1 hypothetical protein [Luteibacter sp. Sphag1AF]
MPRVLLCLALSLISTGVIAAVPVWGARQSSPADTSPATLKPGEWIWGADGKVKGPMAVIVSLTEQRAYAYQNGILVGVATVSTGREGYRTPTGVFTILQKDKDHRSNKYNNAPMPYQQRLTWDGVALHAGGVPGYPESHGCVHLPTGFARALFDATPRGMTVVVSEEGASPASVVHPRAILPIDPTSGAVTVNTELPEGQTFTWHPETSPEGPLSMVLSAADDLLVVYRNGVEIGRTRIVVTDKEASGTHAYIVAEGFLPGDNPLLHGTRMPNWITIGIPGHGEEAGKVLDAQAIDRVVIPPDFLAGLLPLLTPGVVLVTTDQNILPGTTSGGQLQLLDAKPPTALSP